MTVQEAIEDLQKLADAGHGELILIGRDGSTGDTAEVLIGEVCLTQGETMGVLCEWDEDEEYVSVYFG